jgi:HSP20 family protein
VRAIGTEFAGIKPRRRGRKVQAAIVQFGRSKIMAKDDKSREERSAQAESQQGGQQAQQQRQAQQQTQQQGQQQPQQQGQQPQQQGALQSQGVSRQLARSSARSRAQSGVMGVWDDPLARMRRMSDEMDIIFESLLGVPLRGGRRSFDAPELWVPQVELMQKGDELVVHADLPGIGKDDVRVEIGDGRLIIQGERREGGETEEGGYRRSEFVYGQFYREIPLPENVDPDSAEASVRDGVLEIRLRAPQRREARRIEVGEGTREPAGQGAGSSARQGSQQESGAQKDAREARERMPM